MQIVRHRIILGIELIYLKFIKMMRMIKLRQRNQN